MTSIAASKSSMIIDGIAASEAIDSSGEILDVKGCDISDFENGVGVLNYEHRGDEAQGASGNDIVGKIIYAKKIYKKEDCADKRQEAYWDSVKLPFVYIRGRLYDGAGHPGAVALAAIIRDAVMHNEPILARFSIEGSTLKKEGQHLRKTIARKVAITLKPANKSAISGLVSDPNAPKPITPAKADKSLLDQILETAKNEVPGRQVLGGHTGIYKNLEVDADPSTLLKMTAQNVRALLKAMEAGQGGGAPSTLTGGAALQREDDRLHRAMNKNRLKNDLRAAVRDMPDSAKVSKEAMTKFFKFKLPEVNEQFIDHFTDLIDDIRTRQVGHWVEKTVKVWDAVKKTEDRVRQEIKVEAPKEEPVKLDIKKPEPEPSLTEKVVKLTEKLAAKKPVEPEPDPEPVAKAVKPDLREETIRNVERMAIDLAQLAKEEAFHPAEPGVVHADIHAVPHFVINDKQKKMVDGMNLNESTAGEPEHWGENFAQSGISNGQWHNLPNGKLGFVKQTKFESAMPSHAHNEVMYHNLLHHMGLGKHITTTTLLRDPDAPVNEEHPEHYLSVQEAVPNAEHFNNSREHGERLYNFARTGLLQKLALANHILGNRDRHEFNFLFGGKDGQDFYLIDHGHTLPNHRGDHDVSDIPMYMYHAMRYGLDNHLPHKELHPSAKEWLLGLKPEKLAEALSAHKAPASVSHAVLTKLQNMQDYLKEEPYAWFHEVWDAPKTYFGFDHWGSRAARQRAAASGDSQLMARIERRNRERTERHNAADSKLHEDTKLVTELKEKYVEALERGEEIEPFDLLKNRLGPEKAADTVRPHLGPDNIDGYVKEFNHRVRDYASREIRRKRNIKGAFARLIASYVSLGAPPEKAFEHLRGEALDNEAKGMGAPIRENDDDAAFRQKLVAWLKPEVEKRAR